MAKRFAEKHKEAKTKLEEENEELKKEIESQKTVNANTEQKIEELRRNFDEITLEANESKLKLVAQKSKITEELEKLKSCFLEAYENTYCVFETGK